MTDSRRHWLIIAAGGVVIASVGCAPFPPVTRVDNAAVKTNVSGASAGAAATPATSASAASNAQAAIAAGGRLVQTTRGTIVDSLALTGRVGGAEEVGIAFQGSGKVDTVAVKAGQRVEAGQLLLEADTKSAKKDLAAARDRAATSALRLQQAQAQVQAIRLQAQQKAAVDKARADSAVADATATLRRAEAQLEQVKAGAPAGDRKAAQDGVNTATAALAAANANLARVSAGPNQDDLRAAQRDQARAQTAVDRAQQTLDHLIGGPDPSALAAAQRDVERAQNSERAAEAMKATDDATKAARDASIANAKLALQDAQDRVAKLQQRPAQVEIDIATRDVLVARNDLAAANDRLAALQKGPDPDAVAKAQDTVNNAQAALDAAQAKQAEVNSHPTTAEQRDAEAQVAAARAGLQRAQAEAQVTPPVDTSASNDLTLLQRTADSDRAQVTSLEADVAAGELHTPFAGIVMEVMARSGDALEPGRPVFLIAKDGDRVIRADVSDKDAARLANGQAVSVIVGDQTNQPLTGVVQGLQDNANGGGRAAVLSVSWPDAQPAPGTKAQATVTIQQKDNALLVPSQAVKTAVGRPYVEIIDSGNRKQVYVETGVSSGGLTEITRGLSDGQSVFVTG